MKSIGYVRVSTDKQADLGVSLEAQAEKIRAMAVVHNAELIDVIVDGGESAKSLNRTGMAKLLAIPERSLATMIPLFSLQTGGRVWWRDGRAPSGGGPRHHLALGAALCAF